MSPEYALDGHFSVKSDVFSFGVLVLEIVSGKKNRGFCHPDQNLNLLGHVSFRINMLIYNRDEECWYQTIQRGTSNNMP
jgi:serine/threonine protein kinase